MCAAVPEPPRRRSDLHPTGMQPPTKFIAQWRKSDGNSSGGGGTFNLFTDEELCVSMPDGGRYELNAKQVQLLYDGPAAVVNDIGDH